MTHAELRQIIQNMQDCDNYLTGKRSSETVEKLAEHAARRAVMERKANLVDRLREAGLNLVDDQV